MGKKKEKPTMSLEPAEISSAILLTGLYLLQGIPLGLVFGSLPFILKKHLSYSDLAVFSFTVYPYSLKLFWSPIVDSVFLDSIGRRKSWIIPMQIITASILFYLSAATEELIYGENIDRYFLTFIFLILVLCAATQDIAVDGWALSSFAPNKRSYASTCQSIGLNTGYFISFIVLLSLNSADFANKWVRSVPKPEPLVTLSQYFFFWGAAYLIATFLLFFKHEEPFVQGKDYLTIPTVFKQMWEVVKLPSVQALLSVLFFLKIGYVTTDNALGLKLLDKGLKPEDLASIALVDFPCQIILGIFVSRFFSSSPLVPLYYAAVIKTILSMFGILLLYMFPETTGPLTWSLYVTIVIYSLLSSIVTTTIFVAFTTYFTIISDPHIGGTYVTLLNTFANLGGTWPKYFVFRLIDTFTVTACIKDSEVIGSCISEPEKHHCTEQKGDCIKERDGFYTVAITCSVVGLLFCLVYIRKKCTQLASYQMKDWRVSESKVDVK